MDYVAARRDLAQQAGADAALAPDAPETPAALERVSPGGFAVVFEATGSPAAVNPALKLAARFGRVVLLGSTRGLVEQFDPYGDVHLKGVTIVGAHIGTHPAAPNAANPWTQAANRRVVLDLLARRELNVDLLISHRVAPDEAGPIYARLAESPAGLMGVLFDWSLRS
jgi:threonine dehydrogenase-like Zn-dependent dehydrogenase